MKHHWHCGADLSMIGAWSDHEIVELNPSVCRAYFSAATNAFCVENYNVSRSGYLPNSHPMLRLPGKVTLRHPACQEKWQFNFIKYCACHEKRHCKLIKYCTCHAKSLSWLIVVTYETWFTMRGATGTSPDTAPAKTHFVLKITAFCASAVCPNFAGC